MKVGLLYLKRYSLDVEIGVYYIYTMNNLFHFDIFKYLIFRYSLLHSARDIDVTLLSGGCIQCFIFTSFYFFLFLNVMKAVVY